MEFSFDRNRDSNLKNNNQPSNQDGIDTSTIANERLRKAIERNRQRQMERDRLNEKRMSDDPAASARAQHFSHTGQSSQNYRPQSETRTTPPPPRPESFQAEGHQQSSFFDNRGTSQQESNGVTREQEARVKVEEVVHENISTRKSVAKPDETEFTPVKRAPRKVVSQISYSTTSKRKAKSIDPSLSNLFVKLCWFFCAILVLRLLFATGGVSDFYSRASVLNGKLEELNSIKKENMQLVREIERMKSDASYQKKLVRDNLGFIASDEHLILFPKEN